MFNLETITRKNIWDLKPYSSARDEYTGKSAIFLDANENPFNTLYNRYPDPQQRDLKHKIADLKKVIFNQVFLGNGSDEPIDLLYRIFCEPGRDNVIIPDPTYGMYQVCADINNVKVKLISLRNDFQPDVESILKAVDPNTKLIFLCSPNNPTSISYKRGAMIEILEKFTTGIVVVDEAYIDFSTQKSLLPELSNYPNLVVLQTFSKAWGLAGIRLGMAFASKEIVHLMTRVKYPYNISILTQKTALESLNDVAGKNYWVQEIISQRKFLEKELLKFSFAQSVLPSDANFLMLKVDGPKVLYNFLIEKKIIVRDRSGVNLCMGHLRITIGTKKENRKLLQSMTEFEKEKIKITD